VTILKQKTKHAIHGLGGNMKNFIQILLFIILLACFISCFAKTNEDEKENIKPKVDLELGKTESEIIKKYGKPTEVYILKPNELIGEIRTLVSSRIPEDKKNIDVKELVFKEVNSVKFYWLIQDEDKNWKVISDIEAPKGTTY